MHAEIIQIPLKIMQAIFAHAQTTPDVEVCGLIGATKQVPICCYPIKNSHHEPQKYFNLDASEHINAIKLMRTQQQELFAIYHSHPHAAALPSITDLALAPKMEILYLIISLNTKGVLELRGFKLQHQQAQECQLNVV